MNRAGQLESIINNAKLLESIKVEARKFRVTKLIRRNAKCV